MQTRKAVEWVIVGSCLLQPGCLALVRGYVTGLNFKDETARNVFNWVSANPLAVNLERELVKAMLQETGLRMKDLAQLMSRGVGPSDLTRHCLLLLEFNFRDEAVRILRTNRNDATRPLVQIERDIENPNNDVWQIVTTAANYLFEPGDPVLDKIANQLSELIEKMNLRAGMIQIEEQVEFHITALRELITRHPNLTDKYKHALKNFAWPYE